MSHQPHTVFYCYIYLQGTKLHAYIDIEHTSYGQQIELQCGQNGGIDDSLVYISEPQNHLYQNRISPSSFGLVKCKPSIALRDMHSETSHKPHADDLKLKSNVDR